VLLENHMPSATLAPTPSAPSRNTTPAAPPPRATDDEILGITSPRKNSPRDTQQLEFDFDADVPTSTTTLSSRARAGVWPDEGLAVPSANENQLQIPRSARNDNPQKIVDTRTANAPDASVNATNAHATIPEPAHLRATLDANPELRAAWRDATAYRESFATPDAAREATALLADVNHMDALFFSRRPEDHASLARAIANMDPAAFTSLAQAMQSIAAGSVAQALLPVPQATTSALAPHLQPRANTSENSPQAAWLHDESSTQPHATQAQARMPVLPETASNAHPQSRNSSPADHAEQNQNQLQIPRYARNDNTLRDADADGLRTAGVSPAPLTSSPHAQLAANSATANEPQLAFLHAANAAAVEGVVAAIEAQVARLLPEGVAKNARTRVVGEIYRELDSSLRSNPQFAAQLRDAFRSGSVDDGHQRAIVSLLTGRARQALPGVAKRVLSEWTSTIVSAANERRTRQRTAERRIDIAGSSGAGNDGRRSMSPRDLDYARLTDADILNL
jgi:hypothetical protein